MGKLIYKGRGASFLGVPARDLTEQDLVDLNDNMVSALLASGLYEAVDQAQSEDQEFYGQSEESDEDSDQGQPEGRNKNKKK